MIIQRNLIPVNEDLKKILDEIDAVSKEYFEVMGDTDGTLVLGYDILMILTYRVKEQNKYCQSHGFVGNFDLERYETPFGRYKISTSIHEGTIKVEPKLKLPTSVRVLRVESCEHPAKETVYKIIFAKEDGSEQEYLIKKTKQDKLVMN